MLVFEERGKPEYPEKNLWQQRTNNKLNPRMTTGPGIEPGTHWWEASALATAPTLLLLNTAQQWLTNNEKTGDKGYTPQ